MLHTVVPGESLFTIALQYQIPLLNLKEVNHLNSLLVDIGQELFIPDIIASKMLSRGIERSISYTVKAGDTLWSIATRFNVGVDHLKKVNNLSSNALQIGQTLNIPNLDNNTVSPSASGGSTSNNSTPNITIHTVSAGESLWGISKKYGATVDEVKLLNSLSSNSLFIGQQLKIPNANGIVDTGGSASDSGTGSDQWYTVKAGDTLNLLAFIFDTTVDNLRKWNNLNADLLRIGQQLIVRKGSTTGPTPPSNTNNNTNTNTAANTGTPILYTVVAGDGLFNIAGRFKVSVAELYRWNNLVSDNLSIGQQLIVGYTGSSGSNTGGGTVITPPPTNNEGPIQVILPSNDALVFKYTITINDTVGNNGKNMTSDVRRVQDQLNRLGFLQSAELNNERPFTSDTQSVQTQYIPQTIAAIIRFQRLVSGGAEDGLIRPNHSTLMFLNTATPIPTEAQLSNLKNALSEFDVTVLEGSAILGNSLGSAVGATNFGNLPADVRKVQQRLEDLGYLNPSHKETPTQAVSDSIPQSSLPLTIQAIRKFQEQRVNFWRDKKVLVNATDFTSGLVGKDDRDFTFRILRDFTEYYVSFPAISGGGKEQMLFNNFVRSTFTVSTNGISYPGEVSPKSLSLQEYVNMGLSTMQAKALKYVSEHEGDFDAINSYDKANFSYGFIQFAGGGGGLAPMLGLLKHKYPQTFEARFQRYGIDVEYALYQGQINDAQLVVVSPNGQILRNTAAEQHLRDNKLLCAVFIKAAYDVNVQKAQIESAKRKFVVPALTITLTLSLPIVRTLASDKKTISAIYVGEQADAYKRKSEYTSLKQQGRIQETSLNLNKNPILEFIRSEKGMTALIDITVNQWINKAGTYFTEAISKVAASDNLDTLGKLRNINERKVLDYISQIGDSRIKERMSNILSADELSSSKA